MANYFDDAELFHLFWENSKLNERTILRLAARIEQDARMTHELPQIFYPTEDLALPRPRDKVARQMARRKSVREFSGAPISEKQLGSLCYAFAAHKDGQRRMVPSAGGKYPIEVYACLFHVSSKLNEKIVYYNADAHSLSVVGKCPPWSKAQKVFGVQVAGEPAVGFVFVAVPERTLRKYGERGGRFILIEVGHYAQNLALRLAQEKLGGVLSGAVRDDAMKKLLGLERTGALITLGFVCGKMPRQRFRWRG